MTLGGFGVYWILPLPKTKYQKKNRGKQRWTLNKSKERERKLDKTSKRKYRGLNTKRKTKITHA